MTKREIINEIMEINLSAEAEFLSRFSDNQLNEYLQHLHILQEPRIVHGGDSHHERVGEVCQVPPTPVCLQDRELGRWDEYLDRTEAKSPDAECKVDTLSESKQVVDCVTGQDNDSNQAWLF